MRKSFILTVILIILTFVLSSCWSSRELNELSIAMAVGIDKSDDGYLLTVQLINPSDIAAQTPSTRTGVTTYHIKGETIFEALRKLTKKTPRKIYLSHLQTIVFSEEFAREDGISTALDFFSRDHELRTDFYIMVSRDVKAEKVLDIITSLEKIPAVNMYNSLEMSEKEWGVTYHIELDELIKTLVSKGKNPVLTGITVTGDPKLGTTKENVERIDPLATVDIDAIAVFKEDKLVGWLSDEESKGFNFIDDNVKSTIINIPWSKDGKLSIEIIRSKTKLKGSIKNNEPKIDIEVTSEANVGEVGTNIDMLKTENIYEMEKKVEDIIKSEIEAAIKKTQKVYESDIFGFGEAIRRADPKAWKELKKDWNENFTDLSVDINVDVKIRRTGTITDSFETN